MENFLPASLLFLLLFVAAVAVYFLSWSFGATGHGGRVSMLLLALVIVAILFLIMDVNRPQRGTFQIGVEPLQRVQAGISDTGDTTQPGPGPNDESPEGG